MRSTISVFRSCLMPALVAGTACAVPAWAEAHDFDVNVVYRLTSLEQVGDRLVVEAEGSGASRPLGIVTAAATVTQSASANPCYEYSAEFYLAAAEGTIQIHSEGEVCPPPTQIAGTWWVTAGTGAFAGATGFGTESGKPSFTGNDPVVDRLEGTLSYAAGAPAASPLSYQECVALNDRYSAAWAEAKGCNPMADRTPQCTKRAVSDLICGCPGLVNSRKRRALRIMDDASRTFFEAGCNGFWDCTAGLCPGAYGAECSGPVPRGTCVDNVPW